MKKLDREFYNRQTIDVAKDLLGKYLVHVHESTEYIGRVVEVEAYLGQHDKAAHSCRGLTPRTKVMFGPPGFAYVYLIYGMYHCMNIVTEEEGHAAAVLLRAVEPIQGILSRTQGPGLLCKAMHIDKKLNACDLLSDHFYVAEKVDEPSFTIVERPRIGVDYAGEWAKKPLRFYINGNEYISKK